MSRDSRTLLLINRNASKADININTLVATLSKLGPVITPECADRAAMQQLIHQYSKTVRRVLIGGGDGTLNGALPALVSTGLPLGVLPLGTANDFARSLGVLDYSRAVEAIVGGHTRRVDVGMVNDHYFLNAVGIGLGPRINSDLDAEGKSRLGVLSYFVNALRHARDYGGMRVVIKCDDESVALRSMQITIGNGIHYGGGMTISSDARLDDGCLRVLSIRPQTLLSLLRYGPALRSGKVIDDENLQSFEGRSITVRTSRETEVTADGEQVATTPVDCRVLYGALTLLAPPVED